MQAEEIRAGDTVRLRDGRVIVADGITSSYTDRFGEHPGPFVTETRTYHHYPLTDVAEIVTRNERTCKFCGGGVTSSNLEVDFCRMCFYRGRPDEDERSEQIARFREVFPDANFVGVEHTGGGCFWFAIRWKPDPFYYVCTDGEASLPHTDPGWTSVLSGGWGYVGRHTDEDENADEYNGVPLVLRDEDEPRMSDEDVIEAIRVDRATRG